MAKKGKKRKETRVAFSDKVEIHGSNIENTEHDVEPHGSHIQGTGHEMEPENDMIEPIDRSERRRPKSTRREGGKDEGDESESEEDIKGGFCYAEDEDDEEDENLGKMDKEVEGEEEENQPEHTSAAEQKDEEGIRYNDAGEELLAFNLKSEREDGYFDANGNFVWKVQEQEPDAWLAGMDEGEMETMIGEAAKAQEKQQKAMEAADAAAKDLSSAQLTELKKELAGMLIPKETVLQALRRLGSGKNAPIKKKRKLPKKLEAELSKGRDNLQGATRPSEKKSPEDQKKLFIRLTELADALLGAGQTDIYQQTVDDINRQISIDESQLHGRGRGSYFSAPVVEHQALSGRQTSSNLPTKGSGTGVMWEYKGVDGVVQGPFPTQAILDWRSQGFFVGDNTVQIRILKSSQVKSDKKSDNLKSQVSLATMENNKQNTNNPQASKKAADEFEADFDSDDGNLDDDDKNDSNRPSPGESSGQNEYHSWTSSDAIDFSRYL